MLAPLWRPIKKAVTAARPQLIFELATRLSRRGHKVSVLGTGDSEIEGVETIPLIPQGLTKMEAVENPFYRHTAFLTLMLKTLKERASEFDLIHNHMYPEFLALLVGRQLPIPMVTTIHAQLTPEMREVFKKFPKSHLVAISQSAKKLAGNLDNISVIYNGIEAGSLVAIVTLKEELVALAYSELSTKKILELANGICARPATVFMAKNTYPSSWKVPKR